MGKLIKQSTKRDIKKRTMRVVAIAIVLFLLLSIVATVVWPYWAAPGGADEYQLQIQVLEEHQSLAIHETVMVTNRREQAVDSLFFHIYPNVFRRFTTLPFDDADLERALPEGFAPGGLDIQSVTVNEAAAEWAVQGADEAVLRVACGLSPGQSAQVEISYYLLLTGNRSVIGVSGGQWRLNGFYPTLAVYQEDQLQLYPYVAIGNAMFSHSARIAATLDAPAKWAVAASSALNSIEGAEKGRALYSLDMEGRMLGLAMGAKLKVAERSAASGIKLRALTSVGGANALMDAAEKSLELFSSWFGEYPYATYTLVAADMLPSSAALPGIVYVREDIARGGKATLAREVARATARQWWGGLVCANPAEAPWLNEGLARYSEYLFVEETLGREAFLKILNEEVLPALKITIPGGMTVDSALARFQTEAEYEVVACLRGAAVIHELRSAMGLERLLSGLMTFATDNRFGIVDKLDLVNALNAGGGSWQETMDDYLLNIGEYANHYLEIYD